MENMGLQSYTRMSTYPFLSASNPNINFGSLYSSSNSFLNSSIYSPYSGINFSAYGFFPNTTSYNLLNSRTNYISNNNLSSATGYSGFGSYNTFNLFNTSSLYSGLQSEYNFLTPSTIGMTNLPMQTSQFSSFQSLNQPSLSNWNYNNFNIYSNPLMTPSTISLLTPTQTQTQTQTNPSASQPANPSEKTLSRGQNYGPEFLAKVKRIANNLNCNYKDLLGVMNSESGVKSDAVNTKSNATGLIQFMPKTAQGLGTSVERLKQMTPIEQLDYVEKYLKQTKRQAGFSSNERLSAGQLYALVFMPAKAKENTFTQTGEKAYEWNAGLDTNNDGRITMNELGSRVKSNYVSDRSFLA